MQLFETLESKKGNAGDQQLKVVYVSVDGNADNFKVHNSAPFKPQK